MSDLDRLLQQKFKLYINTTGAGAGICNQLWKIPGASSFLVGYNFPYHSSQTIKTIGYTPNSFVSKEVAMDLASAAYIEAWNASDKQENVLGIGATCSVASTKNHRGDHKIIIYGISNDKLIYINFIINKGTGLNKRIFDGNLVDKLIENTIYSLLDLTWSSNLELDNAISIINNDIPNFKNIQQDTQENFIQHIISRPFFKSNGTKDIFSATDNIILYPGSFNPLHEGHIGYAKNAAKLLENGQTIFSTVINPAHKSQLTAQQILQRISGMKGYDFLLTQDDPTFLQKARKYPNTPFLLGTDTLLRMLDPKWGHPILEMLNEFNKLKTRFYVSSRLIDNQFIKLNDVLESSNYTKEYEHLFYNVDGRWDISSTEIRNAQK